MQFFKCSRLRLQSLYRYLIIRNGRSIDKLDMIKPLNEPENNLIDDQPENQSILARYVVFNIAPPPDPGKLRTIESYII